MFSKLWQSVAAILGGLADKIDGKQPSDRK